MAARLTTASIVVVTLLAFAAPSEAAFPGANGKIVFSRAGSIWTINADGSSPTQLTTDSGPDLEPASSPDGRKIAFTSERDGGFDIYVMDADGANQTRLTTETDPVRDSLATWSPDGSRIAFSHFTLNGDGDIYVMNADGTGVTNLTNTPNQVEYYPAWSPDGTKIAFAAGGNIFTTNADGSGQAQLTTGGGASDPVWSPDGSKIAYGRTSGGPHFPTQTINVMNADGSGDAPVAWQGEQPAFSPDGHYIVFVYVDEFGEGGLMVITADGSQERTLTTNVDVQPDWQPIPQTYVRPKGATPMYASLVPAYQQCTSPNSSHGAPLSYPSCGARAQSPNLTVGTPDDNGAAANLIGSVGLRVRVDNPATPADEADVLINASATDIRCTPATAVCGSPNGADGPDYTGELQARVVLRITDRNNTPNPGGPGPGTVSDTAFSFTVPCTGTDTTYTIGGDCATATSADAVVPGIVTGGERSNWELGPVQVYDGGPDGVASTTADNTLFLDQGIFVP